MKWTLTEVTAPTAEPITSTEAKVYARVEDFAGATPYSDDDLITDLIIAARNEVEDRGVCCIYQTWDLVMDRFPNTILLPKAPLVSVTYIKYYDTGGTLQTLSSADYIVDTAAWPPMLEPAYGESWPAARDVYNAVTVRFVAGYAGGGTPDEVPQRLRQFIREYVSHKYWGKDIPENIYRLLDGYALYHT